jgi:cation:H+ antiporter
MVAFIARRRSEPAASFRLADSRRVELGMLLVAAIFAVEIAARGSITLVHGAILVALYILYTRRVQGTPGEEPAVVGVPAGLLTLPPRHRRPVIAGLIVVAAAVVVTIANPFADALLATGASFGVDPYFLIQSVVPAASEAPEFVIVAVLVAHRRPAQGLGLLLASAVSQCTLAMGLLPIAYFLGGGSTSMPLGGHGQLELVFLIALTLFAVAALASLRPERVDAALIMTVFAVQFVYPSAAVRIASAFVLLVFAIDLFIDRRHAVRPLVRTVFRRRAASA